MNVIISVGLAKATLSTAQSLAGAAGRLRDRLRAGFVVQAEFVGEATRVVAPGARTLYLLENGCWGTLDKAARFAASEAAETVAHRQQERIHRAGIRVVAISVLRFRKAARENFQESKQPSELAAASGQMAREPLVSLELAIRVLTFS